MQLQLHSKSHSPNVHIYKQDLRIVLHLLHDYSLLTNTPGTRRMINLFYNFVIMYMVSQVVYCLFGCNDTRFGCIDVLPLVYHDVLYDTVIQV